MNGPRRCLNSLPSSGSTPPVLPWKPPQKPSTSALPVAAWTSRSAASTASAPPENIWMRVSPSGVTEDSRSRNFARVGGEAPEGDPLDLALERFDVMRMTVADAAHRDTGDEVDVLVAVLVDQGAVDAARHRQARVEREALRAGGEVLAFLHDDLLRARSHLMPCGQRFPPANRRARYDAIAADASSR